MSVDVLIVDDQLAAANDFARLVASQTKLAVIGTDDVEHALEIVRSEGVAVVVLDERMPACPGTALYARIRDLDQRVRAIMLTGEASGEEVGRAFGSGYADYLHKRDVKDLGGRVLEQFVRYQVDLEADLARARGTSLTLLEIQPRWRLSRHTVTYHLQSLMRARTGVVFPDGWQTVLALNAGESRKASVSHETASSVVLEEETQERLRATAGLSVPALQQLTARLQAEVATRERRQLSAEERAVRSVEVTHTLKEPEDPGCRHVRARHLQRAPSYTAFHALLESTCTCCARTSVTGLTLYAHDGTYATRHLDFYSDGSEETVRTGPDGQGI